MHLKRIVCAGVAALGVTATVGTAAAAASSINEVGSSLVYPLALNWSAKYTGAVVSPHAGGSSKGIYAVQHGQADIGASDAPMTSAQFTGDTFGTPVEIPWALSATGIGYHIAGVGEGLKLSPKVLAEIFSGSITNWGSSAIVKLNPKYKRALRRAGAITPVVRADGSGDTYAFQHFLTVAAGRAWKYHYSTSWGSTAGIGESGNAGVAGEVSQNNGTIGYISAYYLLGASTISVARVENAAGNFEYPNGPEIANAAASNTSVSAQGPSFSGISIVYPSRHYKIAYPISTYTYAIVNKNDANVSAVQAFLNWVISPRGGLYSGTTLDFVPLPGAVQRADAGLINSL